MSTILTELKSQTRRHHDALENELNLLREDLDLGEYRKVLQKFLGYYDVIEKKLLNKNYWETHSFDLQSRIKTPLIEKDLNQLGYTPNDVQGLPRCKDLPEISSFHQALGCIYVMEGATLGGQILSRHFEANLGITAQSGCAFFKAYGANTGTMWKSFQETLVKNAQTQEIQSWIILGAYQTFSSIHEWMKN